MQTTSKTKTQNSITKNTRQMPGSSVTNNLATASLADIMDVRGRLHKLQTWQDEYRRDDHILLQMAATLDMNNYMDLQKSIQITNQRRRLRMKQVTEPFEISPKILDSFGYETVREHLSSEYARMTNNERRLWLSNLLFIMTPQIRELNDKLTHVRHYRSFGQQRNFLLGGVSGAGKTTYLDWYTYMESQTIGTEYNRVPVVKVDAPKNNKTSKPLFERIVRECGKSYNKRDSDEELLMKVVGYFQNCGVEILILDEIEHITNPDIRRRVLEISNLTPGIPIICASCQPTRWTEGDAEVAGRWNDYFQIEAYADAQLSGLLAYIEMFLPFSKPSHLSSFSLKTPNIDVSTSDAKGRKNSTGPASVVIDGPARMIANWTGGVFRDMATLLTTACTMAIDNDIPSITPVLLQESMRSIRTAEVPDSPGAHRMKAR